MNIITNGHNLYVHIPSTLKVKIDSIFINQSVKTREKIYFLIHQINNEDRKNINQRKYNNLLALTNGINVATVLQLLLDNNIVKLASDYVIGSKSKEFKLSAPYPKQYDKQTDFQLYYNDPATNPKWVNKFLSQFAPKEQTTDAAIIAALTKENAELKATIAMLQSQLANSSVASQHDKLPVTIEVTPAAVTSICNDDYLSDKTPDDDFFSNPDNLIDRTISEPLEQTEEQNELTITSTTLTSPDPMKNTYNKDTDIYTIINEETGKKYFIKNATALTDYFATATEKSKDFIKRRLSDTRFENLPKVMIKDMYMQKALTFSIAEIKEEKEYVMKLIDIK